MASVLDAPANVMSTGSDELDKKIGGGIPVGVLTLIEGESDSGKSVLTQTLICGSLGQGYTVSLYTTENTTRSLLRQMESIGLDVTDFLIFGRLKVYSIKAPEAGSNALDTMVRHIARGKSPLVVIDSLSPFLHVDPGEVFAFFSACKALTDSGCTIITIVHEGSLDETVMMRLRSMCDAHMRLRSEEVGDKLVKMLEVSKIRGANKSTGNIVSFNVEPGMGMRIIPVSKAKA
jgi:flagellar protein FlaH